MFLATCKKLQFPRESLPVLQAAEAALQSDPAAEAALDLAGDCFTTAGGSDPMAVLSPLAEKAGIPCATVILVCLIRSVPKLQALYRTKGISEEILWDTLTDLSCKLREHHAVYGIWGTEVVSWYQRLFSARILKLGRLEYEPLEYRWDTPYGDVCKGSPVLNIHIPSCGSLPPQEVLESLKKAFAFFGGKTALPFVCSSWMLYPPMCEQVFARGSNLDAFYRCFDIVEQLPDPANKDFWRIFSLPYSPATLNDAPADTGLRKNLLAWLRQGNCMGTGRGAFLFDGEQCLTAIKA